MSKRKKPKFQVGDMVVMVLYGIVGEVTQLKEIDMTYVYELDGNDGFYLETSLMLLDEYNNKKLDYEQINIDYKFFFGDLVRVPSAGKEIYKVVGFRTEIWRYKNESWEDIIYELARVKDGDWLECSEEEMTLVVDASEAEAYLKKLELSSFPGKSTAQKSYSRKKKSMTKEITVKSMTEVQRKEKIDQLLDLYTDYKSLKENFGDEEFDKVLEMILKKLRSLTEAKAIS